MNTALHTAPIVESLHPVGTQAAPLFAQAEDLQWPTEAATQAFAQALATVLAQNPPLRSAVVELHGELGAGKTTLSRYLLQALGVTGRIKSPSYAVVEPHTAQPGTAAPWPVWHFDFYRFNDPNEWEDAGFRDIFCSPGLKLVEWPDKARAALPVPDLAIHLVTHTDGCRRASLFAHTHTGAALLAGVAPSAATSATPCAAFCTNAASTPVR